MSDNVIIIKREEMVSLLVEAYVAGASTVKEIVNSVKIDPAELKQQFEGRFKIEEPKREVGN